MPATKEDIVRAIRTARSEVEDIVSAAPEFDWSKAVYDQGWNAKQVLCHLALTAGIPSLLISMAKMPRPDAPPSSSGAGGGAVDDVNERMVASLMDRPVDAILSQLVASYGRGLSDLESAPNELLSQPLRTPWGSEGELGELLLVEDLRDHVMVHIRDLSQAVGS